MTLVGSSEEVSITVDVTIVTEVDQSNRWQYNSAWFEHLVGMDVEAGLVYNLPVQKRRPTIGGLGENSETGGEYLFRINRLQTCFSVIPRF